MQVTPQQDDCNPDEISARADEHRAEAAKHTAEAFRLDALAKRRRVAMTVTAVHGSTDLDERAAAAIVQTSLATFRRAKVEADYFVGTRPRWRDADSVRAKFAARGKVPTTPAPTTKASTRGDDLGVDRVLSGAGLRRSR